MKKYIIWSISIILGYYLAFQESNLTIVEMLVLGLIGSAFNAFILFVAVGVVQEYKRRKKLGIDMHAKLEIDPEKVKAAMLYRMQWGGEGGIKETLNQFNENFHNYPQWELHNWEVFRAWYKDQIDQAIKFPEIYELRMKDGSPYDKDKDPLYDPDAPDWEQFDRPRYYYDDDDEDDDFSDNKKDSASDWIYRGIGFGLANSILSGGASSGSSSN
ncbi:MAG: hypothetical protein K2G53_08710 [Muribaculaceae bacterium]|nr:hypothetical protein [Muribaculaceae bacterium]